MDDYMDLFIAIYKQAVKDDFDKVQSKIINGLDDMSIKRRDAMAYLKDNETYMQEIRHAIQHNVYQESKHYGNKETIAMQAKSINSFNTKCEEMIRSYRMTVHEIIDRVKQCKEYDRIINNLIEERERWQTSAEKTTQVLSDMPLGGDGENKRELAICNIADCEAEINLTIDKLCDLKEKITNYIVITGDDDERLVALIEK